MVKILIRETIKPFSRTPPHLRTYNLSEMDLLNPKMYVPLVLIYPASSTTGEQKAIVLKKSLSQTLTRYYPFAGRLPTPASSYVDCNDKGVLFLEARSDTQLDSFQRLQLTHFACGGLALAVSFSHVIGDARTLSSFLSHWASVARYGSTDHTEVLPLNPHFIQSPLTQPPESGPSRPTQGKRQTKGSADNINVSRKFVFPNSRLSELKKKLEAGSVNNPTRFEALTSLVYKTMVAAATARSGCFKPSYLMFTVNMRDRLVPKLPQSTVGNIVKVMID
ncbi:hypothetical protein R6Q59_012840 [Mikania micrantha]